MLKIFSHYYYYYHYCRKTQIGNTVNQGKYTLCRHTWAKCHTAWEAINVFSPGDASFWLLWSSQCSSLPSGACLPPLFPLETLVSFFARWFLFSCFLLTTAVLAGGIAVVCSGSALCRRGRRSLGARVRLVHVDNAASQSSVKGQRYKSWWIAQHGTLLLVKCDLIAMSLRRRQFPPCLSCHTGPTRFA